MTRPRTTLVAFCPGCGAVGDLNKRLSHTFGCDQPGKRITDRLETIRWRRERKRDGWYAEDVDWLLDKLEEWQQAAAEAYLVDELTRGDEP